MRGTREGNHHVLDAVFRHDAVEIWSVPEHRNRCRALIDVERVGIDKADRPLPQLGLVQEALRGQAADLARADDQGRAHRDATPPSARLGAKQGRPADTHQDGRQHPVAKGLGGGVAAGAHQHAGRDHCHRGDRAHGDDCAQLVQQSQPQSGCVRSPSGEHAHRQCRECG